MPENPSLSSKKSNAPIIAVIVILILAVIGLVIWQLSTRSHLNTLLEEKEQTRIALQHELDSLIAEHNKVKEEYGRLSDSLVVKDQKIQSDAEEIKRLLATEWEYYKVKKKLAQLQVVAQGYVRQMDSLYRVNAALTEENIAIKKELTTTRQDMEVISKEREELAEKVDIASVLQAYNVDAMGIRTKSGGEKEVETDKVQRVDQIKVCFTIAQNEIAVPGEKTIYIRIARPDKEILTPGAGDEYTFEYEGKNIQYSIKQLINYENISLSLCVYWRKVYSSQEIPPGLYYVDVFCEGSVIGHTTFALR
jgi:uncharacterized protein YoxC